MVASTSTSPQWERELVVVLVVASTPTSTSQQSEGVLARLSAVILTSQQSEGEPVVVLVRQSAVMSVLSGCTLLEQRHGFNGYSRLEGKCRWGRRLPALVLLAAEEIEGWRLGSRLQQRLSM